MAGALTERDFVEKLEQAGFGGIEVHHREPVSVDDLALYPLFTPELIQTDATLIPPERQAAVATAVVITARLTSARQGAPPRLTDEYSNISLNV